MAALAAQNLLPREGRDVDLGPVDVIGEHGAGGVGEGQALAVGRDPFGVGNAHAAGGAVPGEQNVARPVDLVQIGELTIIGADHRGVQLELLHHIGDPAFAKAFPRKGGHFAGAQHRPHRHFKGAGVGTGDNTDAMGVRQAQISRISSMQ
jgi:hypothetical protein